MNRLALRLAPVVALVVSACGGGDSGVTPPTGPYGDILGTLCDTLARCPSLLEQYPIAYQNRDECMAILDWAFTCRLDTTSLGSTHTFTITQSTPMVDAAHAQACIDWLNMQTCDAIANGGAIGASSPCDGLLVKNDSNNGAAIGASCESSSCAGDAYCKDGAYDPTSGDRTCRTCAALPGAGEPCTTSSTCGSGLYCNYLMAGGTRCDALLADGAACTSTNACQSGFCNFASMICDPHGKDGDACTVANDCRDGHCKGSVCAPFTKNGGACTASVDCLNGDCDPSGVCGHPNGTACGGSFNDTTCASGYCDDTMGNTCQPRLANGTSCSSDRQCVSEYCDVFGTHACVDHCYQDGDCPTGELCNPSYNTCAPPGPDGAACETNAQCAGGHCKLNQTCGPTPKPGDACMTSEDCAPLGYCQAGACAKLIGPGGACTSYDSCEQPYLCLGSGAIGSTSKCTLINLECKPAPAGKMCAYLRVCDASSYCGGDFYCKPRKGAGSACNSSDECDADLYCKSDATGMNACRARGAQGDACTSPDACGAELYCIAGAGGAMTCDAGPIGRPCDTYDAPCPSGLTCDDSHTCVGPLAAGAMCNSSFGPPCMDGLYCDFSTGCSPKKTAGEPCDSQRPCGANLYCSDQTNVCTAAVAKGQTCQTYYPIVGCRDGLRCVYDSATSAYTCQDKLANGVMCSGADDCVSGICDYTYGCLASDMCLAP